MERAELGATARAILGMVALGASTGYEIKQLADKAARHFWAASYGQIYPELRRLQAAGLVVGRVERSGGRVRKVYSLTEAGEQTLRDWLCEPDRLQAFEVRSEGMLKLFFSSWAGGRATTQQVQALRRTHEQILGQLLRLREGNGPPTVGQGLTLELGIAIHTRIVEWCRTAEAQLAEQSDPLP